MNSVSADKSKTTFGYYIIIISGILGLIGSQLRAQNRFKL